METKEIIDALQIKRSLIRISHEIIEHNRGVEDIVLIGIKTRGEILAGRLADIICNVEDVRVPCFALDVSHWRDDREQPYPCLLYTSSLCLCILCNYGFIPSG